MLVENVRPVRCIDGCLQGAGRWEGALRQEWDGHAKEFKPLGPMHCRDAHTGNRAIVGCSCLELHTFHSLCLEGVTDTFDTSPCVAENA